MSFGETLKQKRLERGWTKEYVAERTHLMTRNIDLLESESIKKIPAPIYAKGHIRLYCELLEIDPEPLIQEYLAMSAGGNAKVRPVSCQTVREIPVRPPDPIHTGAHRTLPPKEPAPDSTPKTTTHKLVKPAEDTFTSVPKPEELPTLEKAPAPRFTPPPAAPVVQPAPTFTPPPADLFTPPPAEPVVQPTPVFTPPAEPIEPPATPVTPPPTPVFSAPPPVTPVAEAPAAFTLTGDTLTEQAPAPAAPVAPPPALHHPHRAIFGRPFEQEKRERKVVQQRDRSDELKPQPLNERRIFGPQQPVPEPPNPHLFTLSTLGKRFTTACSNLFTGATRPKVKRLQGDEGRYYTPRMFYQALLFFLILLGLTGIIFAFRYVFRISDAAESEYGLTPETERFELRPVATPPESFFD